MIQDITAQYKKRHEFEVNRHILDTNGRHNKHHASKCVGGTIF